MKWKRWKLGLVVAFFTGGFTALIALSDPGIGWKTVLVLFLTSAAKDAALFLKQHPLDSVQDTEQITKAQLPPINPT